MNQVAQTLLSRIPGWGITTALNLCIFGGTVIYGYAIIGANGKANTENLKIEQRERKEADTEILHRLREMETRIIQTIRDEREAEANSFQRWWDQVEKRWSEK